MKEKSSKPGWLILTCVLTTIVGIGCGGGCRSWKGISAAPSRLVAIPYSISQVNLGWSDVSNNETGFQIERKTGVSGTWARIATVGTNATSYTDTGLTTSTTYYYRVRAYSATGKSSYSSEVSVTTLSNNHSGPADKSTPPGMSSIPAGCFNMGDAFGEGYTDEFPVHVVCLPAFNMDVHEVTNAEYANCVSNGGCPSVISYTNYGEYYYGNAKYNDFPMNYISWNQATSYCKWAGKRLPTEAEWEYAARGGLSGKRYPWGDSISGDDANFNDSGDVWDNDTSPVRNYAANGYGLYDMSGNVSEWVNDWYAQDYYTGRPNPDNDPAGPITGTYRVVRGGSWKNITYILRISYRYYDEDPAYSGDSVIGFRCAKD